MTFKAPLRQYCVFSIGAWPGRGDKLGDTVSPPVFTGEMENRSSQFACVARGHFWVLGAGCRVLGAGCWVVGGGCRTMNFENWVAPYLLPFVTRAFLLALLLVCACCILIQSWRTSQTWRWISTSSSVLRMSTC